MINFSENYNRENFQFFLESFLPGDYIKKEQELNIENCNAYFKKATLLGSEIFERNSNYRSRKELGQKKVE